MNELKTVEYLKEKKQLWDEFITNSKNGNFLFYRDYMEYHSERFTDHSLMFYEKDNLVAVMPANIKDKTLSSHAGLTFGGIISNRRMKTPLMIKIFESMKEYLSEIGIRRIIYKTIPHIYHKIPAEEDLYTLFLNNAKLVRRDVSSTVFMKRKEAFTKGRRWCINKSKTNGLEIKRDYDFKIFMNIEKANLNEKYGVKPTHTPEEMHFLASKFPENIKLFSACIDGEMVSGTIVYESDTVAHTQYIASTEEGRKLYATDLIFDFLINDYYSEKEYFDYGISTENNGSYLNKGLIEYKESFGARSIVHDQYAIDF